MRRDEAEHEESGGEGAELGEGWKLEGLREKLKRLDLEKRKEIAIKSAGRRIEEYRARLQGVKEKESWSIENELRGSERFPDSSEKNLRAVEFKNFDARVGRDEKPPGGDVDESRGKEAERKTGMVGDASDGKNLEEGKEGLLEALKWDRPTVLVSGKVFSFSLFSEDVLDRVFEAEVKARSEGNGGVLQACREALHQFREEGCIDISHLSVIVGYLRRPCGEEGSVVEAGASQDICTSELQKVEELLKFLGARYTRSSGGLSMLEPLEPYVRVDIPVKQLEEMSERLRGDGALGTVERLYEDLERRGVPKSLGFEELGRFLRSGKDVPVDVYLKICRRLGVRVDLGVVARWRSPAVDIATGEWYSRSDVAVRVEPADLRRLYEELLEKLKSEGISLDRFAAMLADAGAVSARGSDVKEILGRRYVDTVTLSEICAFLGREPSEVRELDQSSMSKWESVLLSRRDIRRIRFEAWKKYGSNYYSELAKDTNTSGVKIKHCLLDGRKIPLEVLGKIEEVLGIKLGGSFHDRVKIRFKDYGREVMRGEGGAEALVEKIEVNDPREGKREILTFIHRRGKDGSITREVKQTGETFDPSTTLWFFSLPNTRVTVDRTKELREGKDLLTYIAEKSIEKAGSLSRAEKILNVSSSTLGRWLGDKESNTLTLINLLTLAMYSGAVDRLSELTDYVEKVGPMEKKNRPNLTIEMRGEDAAYVVTSIVFGDGSFRKRGRSYELEYSNKEEENVERMEEKMWNVFGVKPSRGLRKDGFHYLHIYSSLAGISLLGIGLLFGEKTLINQGLPKFIVEGTVQEHKASIEAMVADEGHIEEYSGISVLLTVGASELEECRGALNQIEGVPVRGGVKGEILGKFIATRKLPEEIKTKVEEKELKVLKDEKEILLKLLKEHGINLKEDEMPQIKTQGITIYSDHISISKKLRIDKKIARELHKILGGFLGYKVLMYVNCATAWRAMPMKPIKLSAEDVESLKRIGTQRIIHSEICYIIPVEKLPEKLKRYASPPEGMLRLQKDYSEEEVEIFIEGKPLRVKGMPSRIKGEVRIYPDRNTIFWTLKPATAKTIKEKWKGLKPLLQKEIIEGEKKEEEST